MDDPTDPFRMYSEFGNSRPFRRMLALAQERGCRTLVVSEVPDTEEWLYAKRTFQDMIPSRLGESLQRIDLFTLEIPDEEALSGKVDELLGSYLGYILLRPAPLSSVLEAVIKTPKIGENHFLTCNCAWEQPGLDGWPDMRGQLQVDGALFMEQDGLVAVCAHACLRMATSIAHKNFPECHELTTQRVYESGKDIPIEFRRRLPSEGMNVPEMLMSLERAGYAPLSFLFDEEVLKDIPGSIYQPDQVVYRYIESGLPVILLLRTEEVGHAVVVVGHTFDPHSWWPEAESNYYPTLGTGKEWISSILWVPALIINDDNFGPYLNMPREALRQSATAAIVPLPQSAKVFLTAEQAEAVSAYILYNNALMEEFASSENTSEWYEHVLARQLDRKLVLRTLLLPKPVLAEHVAKSSYSDETTQLLGQVDYPDWVWMVEISTADIYGSQIKFGEVILDPRVPLGLLVSGLEAVLAVHLPGFVWAPANVGGQPVYVEGDRPSGVFARADYAKVYSEAL